MSFAYVVTGSAVLGNKKFKYGTFSNVSSGTGGDIVTGLKVVNAFIGTTMTATAMISSTNGGTVTITVGSTDSGTWAAIGV